MVKAMLIRACCNAGRQQNPTPQRRPEREFALTTTSLKCCQTSLSLISEGGWGGEAETPLQKRSRCSSEISKRTYKTYQEILLCERG